ncbi:hypothetical protein [Exiguobacterium sp. s133]|uniref:hypothetical protein n=1 Tax=Exiguobacterium sp. s133 TaxID=2751213 RepID=UPI001BE8416F|nr:hypothetical protein [Exiguobacterium sp. s133]
MRTFILLTVSTLSGLYQTFVFMKAFNWFVSPTFDVPTLGYGLTMALTLTLSLVSGMNRTLVDHHYENNRMNKNDLFESGLSIIIGRVVLVSIVFVILLILKATI